MNTDLLEYLKQYTLRQKDILMESGDKYPLNPQEAARIRAFVEEVYEKLMKRDEEKGTGEHS